ncbi:MAG: RDD family protein [Saprospiraceae bacterium]
MKTIDIRTTQNVLIEYELANSGQRIFSFILDMLIVLGGYLILMVIGFHRFFPDERVLLMFLPLLVFLTYYYLCQLLLAGQTLGMKAQHNKVVRIDGEDPTPADYLLRTLLLLPDAILSLGIPAILLINGSARAQRLGDIVANTAVIRARPGSPFSLEEIRSIQTLDKYVPLYPEIRRFSEDDMLLIKRSINRYARYPNDAHVAALIQLSNTVCERLGIERPADQSIRDFLRTLLQDYIVLTR